MSENPAISQEIKARAEELKKALFLREGENVANLYAAILRVDPKFLLRGSVQYDLARVLEKSGDDVLAFEAYRLLIEHQPDNKALIPSLRSAGHLAVKLKKYELAQKYLAQFLATKPLNAERQEVMEALETIPAEYRRKAPMASGDKVPVEGIISGAEKSTEKNAEGKPTSGIYVEYSVKGNRPTQEVPKAPIPDPPSASARLGIVGPRPSSADNVRLGGGKEKAINRTSTDQVPPPSSIDLGRLHEDTEPSASLQKKRHVVLGRDSGKTPKPAEFPREAPPSPAAPVAQKPSSSPQVPVPPELFTPQGSPPVSPTPPSGVVPMIAPPPGWYPMPHGYPVPPPGYYPPGAPAPYPGAWYPATPANPAPPIQPGMEQIPGYQIPAHLPFDRWPTPAPPETPPFQFAPPQQAAAAAPARRVESPEARYDRLREARFAIILPQGKKIHLEEAARFLAALEHKDEMEARKLLLRRKGIVCEDLTMEQALDNYTLSAKFRQTFGFIGYGPALILRERHELLSAEAVEKGIKGATERARPRLKWEDMRLLNAGTIGNDLVLSILGGDPMVEFRFVEKVFDAEEFLKTPGADLRKHLTRFIEMICDHADRIVCSHTVEQVRRRKVDVPQSFPYEAEYTSYMRWLVYSHLGETVDMAELLESSRVASNW